VSAPTSPSAPESPGANDGGDARDPTRTRTETTARPLTVMLMRGLVAAGPVLYFGWLLARQIMADWPALAEPRLDWETALSLAAAGYLGLVLASYWRKPPPLAARHDWQAVLATVVAIDALGLSVSQPVTRPDAAPLALALMLAGTLVAAWGAWTLGRAFSLLPQARQLVITGPYRYVRHPIYLGGFLITLGEVWLRWSPLVLGLNLLFVAAQLVRLRYEEDTLSAAFPEYADYRARTSCVVPGIV